MKTSRLIPAFVVVVMLMVLLVPSTFVESGDEFDFSDVYEIEKQSGRDFVLLQFTDTHIQSKTHAEKDVFPYMRDWVKTIQPDMITITGDGVNGDKSGNNSDMCALIEEMNSYCIPWTYIFGNHEKDATVGVRGLSEILSAEANTQGSYLMYKEGNFTKNGRYGNYIVNVMQRNKLIYSLFFMDSGREYETFLPEQTAWYANAVKGLSVEYCGEYAPFDNKVIPSMVFHHVPTDEYQYAANSVLTEKLIDSEDGHTYDNVMVGKVPTSVGSGANYEFGYGQRDGTAKNKRIHNSYEDKNSVDYNMYLDGRSQAGFVSVAKDLHSTTHMFCGHRHTNDATILFEGITYTFGTKTGLGNSSGKRQIGCTSITIKNKTNKVVVQHKYDEEA